MKIFIYPLVFIFFAVIGCTENTSVNNYVENENPQNNIITSAIKTFDNYRVIRKKLEHPITGDILSQYWDEGLHKLKPNRIYLHNSNIVVQQSLNGLEKGVYINLPHSSFKPQPSLIVDGFKFSPTKLPSYLGGEVFTYSRVTAN